MDQNIKKPLVTVLMPVYNASQYLREAIESILTQNFTHFEFLIINDGSTDESLKIIETFKDDRIRLLHNETNIGLIKTLNRGLKESKGEYIVRMDADDISLPSRIEKQVNFMNRHLDIGVAGTWFQILGTDQIVKHPLQHEEIKIKLLFYAALGHPTVIIRKSLFEKHDLLYSENYLYAEDYELWTRCARCFSLANIPEVLVHYRTHQNQITQKQNKQKEETVVSIRASQLQQLSINPSSEQLAIHHAVSEEKHFDDLVKERETLVWFEELYDANKKTPVYDQALFFAELAGLWKLRLCLMSAYDLKVLKIVKYSVFRSSLKSWDLLKVVLKCLFNKTL